MSENDDLMELFDLNGDEPIRLRNPSPSYLNKDFNLEQPSVNFGIKSTQWSSSDGEIFLPTSNTTPTLIPGYYEIDTAQDIGLYFRKLQIKLDGIIRFPDAVTDRVLKEVETFWAREAIYQEYDLTFKRGLLLYSKPGTGKSSTLQLISKDVIDKGGIVFKVTGPKNLLYYVPFIRDSFRKIQPDTPIITIIEDIDEYDDYSSELLDFLDGKNHINHHVVIATTNNTEDIDDTLLRPSRIDLRIEDELPSKKVRTEYFKFKKVPDEKIKELVNKSTEFSLADLKELYICVFLLDYTMDSAVEKISVIKEKKNYLEKDSKNISLSI